MIATKYVNSEEILHMAVLCVDRRWR